MSQTPSIALTNLIVTYRRVPAVHHVTGTFAPGSLTAIAGPNGAGKSTLLKAIMGLLPISDGRIDSGAELFGSATKLKNGARAANGFEAMKEIDSNDDGVLNSCSNRIARRGGGRRLFVRRQRAG